MQLVPGVVLYIEPTGSLLTPQIFKYPMVRLSEIKQGFIIPTIC